MQICKEVCEKKRAFLTSSWISANGTSGSMPSIASFDSPNVYGENRARYEAKP